MMFSSDVFRRTGIGAPEEPILMLAPMDGITNACFREELCAAGGVDMVATEFVRVTGPSRKRVLFARHEIPLQIQFMASEPAVLADSISAMQDSGSLSDNDWLDLNAGCPSRRVNQHGAGAALLTQPQRLSKLLEAMRSVHAGPLSVKMRCGWADPAEMESLLSAVADSPVDFLTLHARTRMDAHNGGVRIHRECLTAAVERLPVPVIANGEIWTAADALSVYNECGVRGLMCGRGAVANPFIFADIRRALRGEGCEPSTWPATSERSESSGGRKAALFTFARALFNRYRELGEYTLGAYKEFARWFSRNPLVGEDFFNLIKRCTKAEEVVPLLNAA